MPQEEMQMAWAKHWFWSKIVDPVPPVGIRHEVEKPYFVNGAKEGPAQSSDSNDSHSAIPRPVGKINVDNA